MKKKSTVDEIEEFLEKAREISAEDRQVARDLLLIHKLSEINKALEGIQSELSSIKYWTR